MSLSIDLAKAKTEYGSLKAFALRLDVPYTTVLDWRRAKNGVPAWRIDKVAAIAREDGKDIFAEAPPAKRKRRAA